jgi:hypothetical protein
MVAASRAIIMSSAPVVLLCLKLSHDAEAPVREIARRCLASYDEFSGLRYAKLTATDETCLAASTLAAQVGTDTARASLLVKISRIVNDEREAHATRLRGPTPKPRRARAKPAKSASSATTQAIE